MQKVLLYPSYFPSISQYVAMMQHEEIIFEVEDNFQKQTKRNRMYIHSPNGLQMLNIPVKHDKTKRQKTKDVRIENDFNWQKNHFKSLEAAYRTSPFFEYFEDELQPLFFKRKDFLMDLNFEIFEVLNSFLKYKPVVSKTIEYFKEIDASTLDARTLIVGKKDNATFEKYTQVFEDKNGFLNNLSVIDLLFNEGKYAKEYLISQKL